MFSFRPRQELLQRNLQQNSFFKPDLKPFNPCQKGLERFYLKWTDPNKDFISRHMLPQTLICWAFDTSLYKHIFRYQNSLAYQKVFDYLNNHQLSIIEMHGGEIRLICQILANCINSIYFERGQNLQFLKIFIYEVWKKINSHIADQKLNQSFRLLIMSVAIRFPKLLVINGVLLTLNNFQTYNPPREFFYSFLSTSIFNSRNHQQLSYDQIQMLLAKFSQEVYCSLKQETLEDYSRIGIVFKSILTQLTRGDRPLCFQHALSQKLNENLVHWTCIRRHDSNIYHDWIRFLSLKLNSMYYQKIYKIYVDNFILIVKKKCQKEIIQSKIIQFLDQSGDLNVYFFIALQKIKKQIRFEKIIDMFLNNLQTSIVFFTVLNKNLAQNIENVYQFLLLNDEHILYQLANEISSHLNNKRFFVLFQRFMFILYWRYFERQQMKTFDNFIQAHYENLHLESIYNDQSNGNFNTNHDN